MGSVDIGGAGRPVRQLVPNFGRSVLVRQCASFISVGRNRLLSVEYKIEGRATMGYCPSGIWNRGSSVLFRHLVGGSSSGRVGKFLRRRLAYSQSFDWIGAQRLEDQAEDNCDIRKWKTN